MPYISPEARFAITNLERSPETPGEMNWLITTACHHYIRRKGLSYDTLNSVVGMLHCAANELYRQLAAPYEDEKKQINGSVSELDDHE